ncbi:DUF6177 family protein [Streptomyces griseoincarnatus]
MSHRDTWALLAGLYAGGPEAAVTAEARGAVLRLCAPDGRPLVSVEAPLLVQVPGEAERLLGRDMPVPLWWTEARASGAVPEAGPLAASVCGRLALLLGGGTWPEDAAGTDVVDVRAAVAPDDGQPVDDVLTGTTSVVLADRPVLALTTWLSEVLRGTSETDRALQIVTPPHVRLTAPARATLLFPPPDRGPERVAHGPRSGCAQGSTCSENLRAVSARSSRPSRAHSSSLKSSTSMEPV